MAEKITVELDDPVSGPPVVTIKTWAPKSHLDTLKVDMKGLLWKPRKKLAKKSFSKNPRRRYWRQLDDMLHDYDKTPKPDSPTDAPHADKITVIADIGQSEKTVDLKAYYKGSVVGTLKMNNKGFAWLPRNHWVPKHVYPWERMTDLVDALKPSHRK